MALVTVKYFGILRELTRVRFEKVKIDDSKSLAFLIDTLASMHDAKFKSFVYSKSGKLNKSLAFAVDGDSILVSRLKSIKCGNVKEFALLPPISGG